MTTITAQPRPGWSTLVTVEDLPADAATVTLYRDRLGTPTPVRGWIGRTVSALAFTATDYEVPLARPVVYSIVVTLTDGTSTETMSAPVTVPATKPLITEPVSGVTVELGAITQWPQVDYAGRSSVVQVAGRRSPVVMTDVMDGGTSAPVLRTDDTISRKALRAMIGSGAVLIIRDPHPGVEDTWVSVTKWTEARLTNINTDTRRHHNLDVTHTDGADPGAPAVGNTLADLAAYVPGDLQDIADTWATLLAIAQADLS